MATKVKKIPQLNTATSVSGTDLFPVDQKNKTKKVSLDLLKNFIVEDFAHARDIQLRKADGYIQWKYADSLTWTNLIPLTELQGSSGTGSLSQTVFIADGIKKIFNGISGILSSDALKCIVTVGGATQQPFAAYTVSTENNGSIIFDETPPANLPITVCVLQ